MHFEIISNPAELEKLAPEWSRLWESCPGATPFQLPDWQLPWLRHLGGGQLRTIAVKEAGGLIGLLPLSIVSLGSPPVHTAVLNGTGISDYLDFLAAPEKADAASALLLEALRAMDPDWDVCDLQEIRPQSPLLRLKAPAGMSMERAPMQVCPVLTLPAEREMLDPLMNHKHIKSLRRAHRLLLKSGDVRLEPAHNGDFSDSLEFLFHLHGARWRERSEPGVLHQEAVRSFHRDASALMHQRGVLRIYRLLLNGKTIAVLYLFTGGDCMFCYLAGFDPATEHFSPGAVIMEHAIGEAVAEGKKEFDFLRGNEKYKYLWGAKDRINYRITIKKSF